MIVYFLNQSLLIYTITIEMSKVAPILVDYFRAYFDEPMEHSWVGRDGHNQLSHNQPHALAQNV